MPAGLLLCAGLRRCYALSARDICRQARQREPGRLHAMRRGYGEQPGSGHVCGSVRPLPAWQLCPQRGRHHVHALPPRHVSGGQRRYQCVAMYVMRGRLLWRRAGHVLVPTVPPRDLRRCDWRDQREQCVFAVPGRDFQHPERPELGRQLRRLPARHICGQSRVHDLHALPEGHLLGRPGRDECSCVQALLCWHLFWSPGRRGVRTLPAWLSRHRARRDERQRRLRAVPQGGLLGPQRPPFGVQLPAMPAWGIRRRAGRICLQPVPAWGLRQRPWGEVQRRLCALQAWDV